MRFRPVFVGTMALLAPLVSVNMRVAAQAAPRWVTICSVIGADETAVSSCTGPTVPVGRGFTWKLPFDTQNNEFLYFGGLQQSTTFYSHSLYGYSARTHAFTLRVQQTVPVGQGSGYDGCLDASYNPIVGHGLGFQWFDPVRRQWVTQGNLGCNYNAGFTSRYDAVAHQMLPLLPTWMLSPQCDGTFDCGSVAFDSGGEYVPGYGRAILCCGDGSFSTRVIEFDPVTQMYTNASQQLVGADGVSCDVNIAWPGSVSPHCPVVFKGADLFGDGSILWVFGGGTSTLASNDIYQYEPAARRFTKIAPVGGIKPPPVHTMFPLAFLDSRRHRLVFYAGTNTLWQYNFAANLWSPLIATGNGPLFDDVLMLHGDGNGCGYDSGVDIAVCVGYRSQSVSPFVFELRLAGA